jgi:SOS-response transcriptional repressor LexA
MTFPERLEMLIESRNTTQKDIAKYVGVRYASISDWKKNGSFPRADIALKMAEALGTSVEYLINEKPPEGIPPEILEIARKIAALEPRDRQDILDFIDIKLKKGEKNKKPMETLSVMEPETAYLPDISPPVRREAIGNVIFIDWEFIEIPLLGSTAAGRPIDFGDLDPDPPTLRWTADLIRGDPNDYYCVLVCGTSMTDADIKDGDHALLKRSDGAENGEIMLVRFDDSSTLKRVKVVEGYKGREEVYICWEDGSGQKVKLEGEGVEIQGKLVAIERKPGKR